jgi:hypothetical protein
MRKIDFEMANWVSRTWESDIFATVTFKQNVVQQDGSRYWTTWWDIERACAFIRDRMFRRCKGEFTWVTSIETGGGEKRMHAHIAMKKPDHIEFEEFRALFFDICNRIELVHDRIDVQPISNDDGGNGSRKVLFYMFKEGVDAISLSASHLSF